MLWCIKCTTCVPFSSTPQWPKPFLRARLSSLPAFEDSGRTFWCKSRICNALSLRAPRKGWKICQTFFFPRSCGVGCSKAICVTSFLHLYKQYHWYFPFFFNIKCKKGAKHHYLQGFLALLPNMSKWCFSHSITSSFTSWQAKTLASAVLTLHVQIFNKVAPMAFTIISRSLRLKKRHNRRLSAWE